MWTSNALCCLGGNAAAGFTVDNNNLATDDTIDDWVVGNNPGNDDTQRERTKEEMNKFAKRRQKDGFQQNEKQI